mmetsp:Transcript_80769/g.143049  ORF Transcript_80769/g.143049 Transcript_80769/m.143049 type:complete len:274 (-) Transcript_80769:11-832(-)
MSPCGARCDARCVWALGVVLHGNETRSQVDEHLGNETRRYLPHTPLGFGDMSLSDLLNATNATSKCYTCSHCILLSLRVPACIIHGLVGSHHGILDERCHLLGFFLSKQVIGIELPLLAPLLDVCRNLCGKALELWISELLDACLTIKHRFPRALDIVPKRGHQTETSNHHTARWRSRHIAEVLECLWRHCHLGLGVPFNAGAMSTPCSMPRRCWLERTGHLHSSALAEAGQAHQHKGNCLHCSKVNKSKMNGKQQLTKECTLGSLSQNGWPG